MVLDNVPLVNCNIGKDILKNAVTGYEELRRIGKEIVDDFDRVGYTYITNFGIEESKLSDVSDLLDVILQKRKEDEKFHKINMENKTERPSDAIDIYGPSDMEFEAFEHRDIINVIIGSFQLLSRDLVKSMKITLEEFKSSNIDSNGSHIHFTRFPQSVSLNGNSVASSSPSSNQFDSSYFTLLYFTNKNGFQLQNHKNEWSFLTPIPGSLVLIAGTQIEAATEGRIKATGYRFTDSDSTTNMSTKSILSYKIF